MWPARLHVSRPWRKLHWDRIDGEHRIKHLIAVSFDTLPRWRMRVRVCVWGGTLTLANSCS